MRIFLLRGVKIPSLTDRDSIVRLPKTGQTLKTAFNLNLNGWLTCFHCMKSYDVLCYGFLLNM